MIWILYDGYIIYIINMDLHFATCPLFVLTRVLCAVTVYTSTIQKKGKKSISNIELLNGCQHQLLVGND
jgi:glycerol-3-phosphate responsive antiterminator